MKENNLSPVENLELAVDAAMTVFKNGGSARAASKAFDYFLKGTNLKEAGLFTRLDCLGASARSGEELLTIMKPVGDVSLNLTRVSELLTIVNDGKEIEDKKSELQRINNIPNVYKRGMLILFSGIAAASFSRLAGCDWYGFVIAFVAGIIGQTIHQFLIKQRDFISIVIFFASLSACLVAAIGLKLGYSTSTIIPLFMSSIIYLVPGIVLIFGFFDMLSIRFFTSGIQRLIFATLIFAILFLSMFFAIQIIKQ